MRLNGHADAHGSKDSEHEKETLAERLADLVERCT